MNNILLFFAFVLTSSMASAQSIAGTWQTIDHETGNATSYVHLYEQGGVLYGKITKLLRKDGQKICDKCTGDRKGKSLIDMVIIEDMKLNEGYYQGGNILNPQGGNWYACKIWLKENDPNTLVVRGSLGPIYKTQYWSRLQ
ncbi:MAG: DUF2147 domain-containing protein [Saprospiraceae bacterium]|nr:DUF2147 domain-containing protein [Saprospiraceae bacterium]